MHLYLQDTPRLIALVAPPRNQATGPTAILISSQSTPLAPAHHHASSSTTTTTASLGAPPAPPPSAPTVAAASRAVVEVATAAELDNLSLQKLTSRPIAGCLGLINVANDLFVAVVTSAVDVGPIRTGEHVMKITSVAFYCVNRSTWDDTLLSDVAPASGALDPYDGVGPGTDGAVTQPSVYEHPCASLRKLLGTGTFYYAKDAAFDISTRLDRRLRNAAMCGNASLHDISQYDGRFVWNNYMIEPLIHFRSRLDPADRARLDSECFFLLAIQGFVGVYDMVTALPASSSNLSVAPASASASSSSLLPTRSTCSIAVISRLSWKRAGTRFNTRGIDDDGNVANFVESETVFSTDDAVFSYNQVRGSVPLFWEQQGLQAFNARIQVTRSRVASQPAFDRHFADLISHYSQVHAINLLGTRDAETVLSAAYAEHARNSAAEALAVLPPDEEEASDGGPRGAGDDAGIAQQRVGLTNFDFHAVSRATGGLDGVRSELRYLGPVQLKRKAFGYTVLDPRDNGGAGALRKRQMGVFRTNCLDCLDRTNVVQDMLSQSTLESFLEAASAHRASFEPFTAPTHPLWTHHRVLWAENGDALSKIYAGTGALNTSFTRSGKKTLGGLLSDAAKSAGRMYINNFQDKGKQNVIDVLLGNMANQRPVTVFDPVVDSVSAELSARIDEYSSSRTISVFAGTFNLNGKPPSESLVPWLFPQGEDEEHQEPDIFAIGFQEIVQLTPQQILMTDPDKIRQWEAKLIDTLSRRARKRSDYVLLRSEQLVGTALILLVKEELVHHIRSVEAATKKTGLKGMSGNKGGVAIRLQVSDTSLCFVTAHFAAGHSNYEERNADYWTISRGLLFNRGRTIASHDAILWLGDFNYRIDLPNDLVRSHAVREDLTPLYPRDQLSRSREANAVFPGYEEGSLDFPPTYKYDNNATTYDSSEKQRIPAWTDRILYRGAGVELVAYNRVDEIRMSDHRPVYASFRVQIRTVDEVYRDSLRRELMERKKGMVGLGGRQKEGEEGEGDGEGSMSKGVEGLTSGEEEWEEEEEEEDEVPEPSDEHWNWWDDGGTTAAAVGVGTAGPRSHQGPSTAPFGNEPTNSLSSPSTSSLENDIDATATAAADDEDGMVEALSLDGEEEEEEEEEEIAGGLEGEDVGWMRVNPFRRGRRSGSGSGRGGGGFKRVAPPPPPPPTTTGTGTGTGIGTGMGTGLGMGLGTTDRRVFSGPASLPVQKPPLLPPGSGVGGHGPPPPPPPPTTSGGGGVGGGGGAKPTPPPIPLKPTTTNTTTTTITTTTTPSTTSTTATATAPPKVPQRPPTFLPPSAPSANRPALGPRSASYSSQRSGRSLLDDSD